MKSDIIRIDNRGNGFQEALEQTAKAASFRGLNHKEELRLRLCTEEMLSLARSVTGEMQASFWLESEGKKFDLHMSTKTVMDREKRERLIASASSRKNEAANSFLGRLRDAFEAAMVSDPISEIPDEALPDLANHAIEIPEWDEYEQSILRSAADDVKIAIRGGTVDMTVSKSFE
ncbi:MAG: hypothetical protein IK149_05155 [Oscillospiraceae bacterium]|nr:hypothetical protein [Oscillospiraceae bacterium]